MRATRFARAPRLSMRFVVAGALAAAVMATGSFATAQRRTYTLDADFDTGTLDNVRHVPSNQLVLGRTRVSQTRLVWTTNYNVSFVVRMDSTTGRQTSRFDSALQFINGVPTGARPSQEWCNWSNTGNCPGRVAVDANGDVWIINRAFGNQGTLSKFSGNLEHCIDRNNDGQINTSRDANNDGLIAVNDPAEYFGQNDECVLATIPVGTTNQWPRGVAVDKRGKIWAGTHNDGRVYRYNPNEPVALEQTVVTGGNPYSLATGGDYLFVSRSASGPARVHITSLAVQTMACPGMASGTYGVVADPGGNVAWFGGYFSGDRIWRADFSTNTCTSVAVGGTVTAMTLDLDGNVWAANYGSNTVHKLAPNLTLLGTYAAGGTQPHGLSVDFDGNIWIVTHTPNMVKKNTSGTTLGTYSIGGPGVSNADPYLYSDFTGVQIDRQAPYTYVGSWDAVYDGGADNIPWSHAEWNLEPQGAVPAETSLVVSVRAANSLVALGLGAYAAAGNGQPLAGVSGRYVQVRAGLKGPGFATPVLADLGIVGPCDPPNDSCCVTDADCGDASPCTVDTCPVPGGPCSHALAPGCCLDASDCDDGLLCTTDSCPVAGGLCGHAAAPGCCNSNNDCDDGDACTIDLCSGPGGTCSHPLINGCCNTDLDCTLGNLCSNATCPVPGGFCVGGMIPGCCTDGADCADLDLCTSDVCDVATNTCANALVAGCCNLDFQCDDDDVCTSDTCSGLGGVCGHSAMPGCCTPGDPSIGQPCDEPVAPFDSPPCRAGEIQCDNGVFTCDGAVRPSIEQCNFIDDDCDGVADSPAPCPVGTLCTNGVCASQCEGELLTCPGGYECEDGLCIPTDCSLVICPEGELCVDGRCLAGGGGAGGLGGGAVTGGHGGASAGGAAGAAAVGGETLAPGGHWGLPSGGGGCLCTTAPARSSPLGWLAGLAMAAGLSARRTSRERSPRRSR